MNKQPIEYQTSEKIIIDYQLATVFERIGAQIIDTVIKIGLFYLFYLIFAGFLVGSSLVAKKENSVSWIPLIISGALFVILILFLLFYNFIFELAWKGQTPGKKILRIRVVNDDGSLVNFMPVLLRNLFRLVDSLPLYYGVGLIMVIVNKKRKRIGDLVAGTVVIKEELIKMPALNEFTDSDCFATLPEISAVFNAEEKEILFGYYESYSQLNPDVLASMEERIIRMIYRKTSIEKPVNIGNKEFILALLKRVMNN